MHMPIRFITGLAAAAAFALAGTPAAIAAGPAVTGHVYVNANTAGRFNLYAVATDDTGKTMVSTPAIVVIGNGGATELAGAATTVFPAAAALITPVRSRRSRGPRSPGTRSCPPC